VEIVYLKKYDNNTEIRRLYVFEFCFSFSLSDTQKEMTTITYCHGCQQLFVLFITFVHGIYNYIPQTGHISRVYSIGALLYSQFKVHVMMIILFLLFFCFCFFAVVVVAAAAAAVLNLKLLTNFTSSVFD